MPGPRRTLTGGHRHSTVPCRRASTTWAGGCSTGYMAGGSRRWSSWPTSRILRSGLGSRLSYHQRVAHRTGHRVGFGLPAAVHLERSRFSQACRHIAPCRAVHGHYHVHSGKTGYPAADAGTRRFPDFGGQPYQSGWLSGIQPVRGGTISAWRSPLPRGSDCRSRTAQIHSLFLHRLLSSRPYRQDFIGLAKPGLIKEKCAPNALSTFEEYLLDYGTPEAREAGERAIAAALDGMDGRIRKVSENLLAKVRDGRRDGYC